MEVEEESGGVRALCDLCGELSEEAIKGTNWRASSVSTPSRPAAQLEYPAAFGNTFRSSPPLDITEGVLSTRLLLLAPGTAVGKTTLLWLRSHETVSSSSPRSVRRAEEEGTLVVPVEGRCCGGDAGADGAPPARPAAFLPPDPVPFVVFASTPPMSGPRVFIGAAPSGLPSGVAALAAEELTLNGTGCGGGLVLLGGTAPVVLWLLSMRLLCITQLDPTRLEGRARSPLAVARDSEAGGETNGEEPAVPGSARGGDVSLVIVFMEDGRG